MSREEKEKIITAVLAKCKGKGFDEQLSIEALSSLNEEDLEYRDNVTIQQYLGEKELTGNLGYCDGGTKTIDEVIKLFQKLKEDGFTKVGPTYNYGDFDGLYVEKIGRESEDMVIKRVFDLVYKQYTNLKKNKEEREKWLAWLEKQDKSEGKYSVWVDCLKMNDNYLTKKEALDLARAYKKDGYNNVKIELIDY